MAKTAIIVLLGLWLVFMGFTLLMANRALATGSPNVNAYGTITATALTFSATLKDVITENSFFFYPRPYDTATSGQVFEATGGGEGSQIDGTYDLQWIFSTATLNYVHAKFFEETTPITESGHITITITEEGQYFFTQTETCINLQSSKETCEGNINCQWYENYEFLGVDFCAPKQYGWTGELCDNQPGKCQYCQTEAGCEAHALCEWITGTLPLPNYCRYKPTWGCAPGAGAKYCVNEAECIATASGVWMNQGGLIGCYSGTEVTEAGGMVDRIWDIMKNPEEEIKALFNVFDIRKKPPVSWVLEIAGIFKDVKDKILNKTIQAEGTMYAAGWGDITFPAKLGNATSLKIASMNLGSVKTNYSNEFKTFRTIIQYICWLNFGAWIIGKFTGMGDDTEQVDPYDRGSIKKTPKAPLM